MYALIFAGSVLFLSTLSLRRATNTGQPVRGLPSYFYPRSPCGERHNSRRFLRPQNGNFYPRSPCGERPVRQRPGLQAGNISIHALLAESD